MRSKSIGKSMGLVLVTVLHASHAKGQTSAPAYPDSCQPSRGGLENPRKALLIGNYSYEKAQLGVPADQAVVPPSLHSPAKDVDDLARALSDDLGFFVLSCKDLDLMAMKRVERIFTATVNPNDEVLFYYSGHGVVADGTSYLVPYGFYFDKPLKTQTPEQVGKSNTDAIEETMYRMEKVLDDLQPTKWKPLAKVALIIIDACRTELPTLPASPKGPPPKRQIQGFAAVRGPVGSYIAFAAAPDEWAQDGDPGENSIFTKALLRHLEEPDDIDTVFRKVRVDVHKDSNQAQHPWSSVNLIDKYQLTSADTNASTNREVTGAIK